MVSTLYTASCMGMGHSIRRAASNILFEILQWAKEKTSIDISALPAENRNIHVLDWYVGE